MEPKLQQAEEPDKIDSVENDGDAANDKVWNRLAGLDREKFKGFVDQYSRGAKNLYGNGVQFCKEKRKEIRHYSLVVAAVLFVVVLFQNFESSQFEFLFWNFPAPKIILFLIMMAIGGLFGYWLRGRRSTE